MNAYLSTALQIAGLLGWITSMAMALWIMSRRTQGWDRGNQAWLQLNGDKDSKVDTERAGLLDKHVQTQYVAQEALSRVRGVQEGLSAYGSKADQIAIGVRKSMVELVREADEARANRDRWNREQESRFSGVPRDETTFVNPEDTGRFGGKKRPSR